MKNNFDLKKFLVENKLTTNSRVLKERNDIVDVSELDVETAFRDAGIDMSKPVLVLTQDGGHGEQETVGTVSAQEALEMFQRLRAEGMEEGREDNYEFDNEINFSAEGYEYKISYFEQESTTTALMQKSEVDEDQERDHQFYANEEGAEIIMQIAKDAVNLMDEQPGTSPHIALQSVLEDYIEEKGLE